MQWYRSFITLILLATYKNYFCVQFNYLVLLFESNLTTPLSRTSLFSSCSLSIHIKVETVYTGRKSPTNGINSARFIISVTLLLVIENNKLDTNTSNMSPIIGTPNTGATK